MTVLTDRPPVARAGGALLATVLGGQFMAVLDVSIVNVAVPSIRVDLHATGAGLQLVVAGYAISYAVLLVTGARLGDRHGHGRAFQAGLAAFTAASLLCGLAPSTGALIACRLLQGAGAALMVPQVFSIIQRAFTGPARTRALGLYGAVLAGAAVAGQALGGFLTDADLLGTGWRPVFLVNVPVGLALLLLGRRHLPADRGSRARTLDPLGVATLAAAVLALVLPLVLGHEAGWPWWTWASLAAAGALFGAFAAVQRRGPAPLISGLVLRSPGLVPACLAILAVMASYAGFLFTLGLHTQRDLGYSPARAGLVLVPAAVGFAVSSLNWRRLPAHWHRRVIPAALLVVTAGYALMAWTIRDDRPLGPAYLAASAVYGLALGAAFSPLIGVALAHVPPAVAADASGVVATVTQLAAVLGVATFGTVYLSLAPAPSAAAVTDATLCVASLLAAAATLAVRRPR
ncbi:MFS transporter [Dactylosporangium aurantiacum]|uniref:MFS transporter n=1 Tax=Dactylosporangium aurantiacum TaxID=35754 RepID=A0A9Q9IFK2_9ACTN|nr:MFS transporter [Dactylosporangium aurantiacum]MDG6100795.1 MFS transporter [Dactylosporangium aurantiacum]UWZ55142.1 MFS transporter [Dactylosporangium aurantiacum]